jgi:phosphomethylpyrimidine synthase
MEYIAIGKTNVLLQEQTKAMQCQHPGNSFCANTPKNYITLSL